MVVQIVAQVYVHIGMVREPQSATIIWQLIGLLTICEVSSIPLESVTLSVTHGLA